MTLPDGVKRVSGKDQPNVSEDLFARHKTLLLLSQQELEEQLVDLLVHWSIRSGDHPALTIGRLIDMMPWDEDEWAEQLIEFREDLFT